LVTAQLEQLLVDGAKALGVELTDSAVEQLLAYLALLCKWNRVYNLTAVSDPEEMVTLHLLDSLSLLAHLPGGQMIDVGAGAGLPGIPLAIARPDWQIDLLDSNSKKTRFMQQARAELGLENIRVHHTRVEDFNPDRRYNVVLSRAFASLQKMLALTAHLCRPGGRFMAMKGIFSDQELSEIEKTYKVERVIRLSVPGLDGERHLLEISVNQDGPTR
jgi:16S rRNA (guanine527-N7)-methyltransferase